MFDVLHLDGWSTRSLPYRERRALLKELALDGLAWRTPASLALERSDAFVAGVVELGLEGVVAKRLDSRYTSGRRAASWIKHKLRRDEQLAVTGVRRRPDGKTEAVFVARRRPDGSVRSAGSIERGLSPDLLGALDDRLAELPARRRGAWPGIRPRCRSWHRATAFPMAPCATRSCAPSSDSPTPPRYAGTGAYYGITDARVRSTGRRRGTVGDMLPLGFKFEVDAVIIDGFAHRRGCQRLPPELPPDVVSIPAAGVHLAERCPRECPSCRPPFETLLTHQLDRSFAAIVARPV